tara:strand:- start:5234 stop:6199 length:966 start_codon:yes stop_codon:yes gene_type:complete
MNRTAVVVTGLLCFLLSSLFCPAISGGSDRNRSDVSNKTKSRPAMDRVLAAASCRVNGCSGTAIEFGGGSWVVTAEHCFRLGQDVTVVTGDKLKSSSGKVVAIDSRVDLALVQVDPGQLTGRVPVPLNLPDGPWSGIGYPKGKGPQSWHGEFLGAEKITNLPRARWAFKMKGGRFANGSSGSGVFRGGVLVGVATHMDDSKKIIYSCTLHDLQTFLSRAGRDSPGLRVAEEGSAQINKTAALVGTGPDSWGDADRTREILELKKRVGELKGTAGPPGPPGPPGLGMDPSKLEEIIRRLESLEAWQRNFRTTVRIRVHPKER